MDNNIQIRKIRMSDISAIEAIEHESFKDPWSRETLVEAVETFVGTVFVAEAGGIVTGFIICGIENTGEEIYGHICNFAVKSEYRHGGIGKALLNRAEYALMLLGATAMQLEVRISNQSAQKFYTGHGYQPVFQINAYYANTEDAIVMMRWFRF